MRMQIWLLCKYAPGLPAVTYEAQVPQPLSGTGLAVRACNEHWSAGPACSTYAC